LTPSQVSPLPRFRPFPGFTPSQVSPLRRLHPIPDSTLPHVSPLPRFHTFPDFASQVLIPLDRILYVQMKNTKQSVSSKHPMNWILRDLWWCCHPMDWKMKTTSSSFTDQPRLCHRKHCRLQHHPCFRVMINLQPRIHCL